MLKFFVPQCQNYSYWIPYLFQERSGIKMFLDIRSITSFCRFVYITVQKQFVVEFFSVSPIPVIKNFKQNRGMSRISFELLSQSTKKTRRGTLMCFKNVLVSKSFWILEVSWFSVEYFLSHSTETFRGRTVFCSTNSPYPEILCILGVSHAFLLKNFFITVPKVIVGNQLFSLSETFRCQKFFVN